MAKSKVAAPRAARPKPSLAAEILQGIDELKRAAGGENVGLKITRGKLAPLAHVLAELKVAREEAGLSLSEVARRSGVRFETVSRLELGKVKNPTVETLQKVADAIGVDLKLSIERRA